jgi:hypothetical protein
MPTVPVDGISNQGFTLQEMLDEVSDQLRDVKINTKITRWLNLQIFELAASRSWPHLWKFGFFSTAPSTRDYDLENTLQIMSVVNIPSIPRTLIHVDEKFIADNYDNYTYQQGDVVAYTLHGSKISLFRVPSSILAVEYFFYAYPLKLTNPGDISDFPVEWHPVLIQGAVVRGFRYEGNTDQLAEAEVLYKQMYDKALKNSYSPNGQRHVLRDSERGRRVPRVTLPSNYPRQ